MSCLPNPLLAHPLSPNSTVNLSVIPVESCGVWSRNVGRVVKDGNPIRGLSTWASMWPQDARIIPLTSDYISATDLVNDDTPEATANADCLKADRGTEGSI